MMDILDMLYKNEISAEDAESMLDKLLDPFHSEKGQLAWADEIGLSEYEASAYAQGASLADLAKFRYEGWPTTCSRCGKPLDYMQYGWWFFRDAGDSPRLRHLVCPAA